MSPLRAKRPSLCALAPMSPLRAKRPSLCAGAPMSPLGAKKPYRSAETSTLRQPA
jgi:hypothetical protein